MKVPFENIVTNIPREEKLLHALIQDLSKYYRDMVHAINGRIGFGDGTSPDNMVGEWIQIATGLAGVENAIGHNLGVIPCGFIMIMPPSSGIVNKGTTAWTTSNIYLTCSAATQNFTIFLLPSTSE